MGARPVVRRVWHQGDGPRGRFLRAPLIGPVKPLHNRHRRLWPIPLGEVHGHGLIIGPGWRHASAQRQRPRHQQASRKTNTVQIHAPSRKYSGSGAGLRFPHDDTGSITGGRAQVLPLRVAAKQAEKSPLSRTP